MRIVLVSVGSMKISLSVEKAEVMLRDICSLSFLGLGVTDLTANSDHCSIELEQANMDVLDTFHELDS